MTKFDLVTKELVATHVFSDINMCREDEVYSFVKGRTIVSLGTRTATTIVGNVYKVFDSSVESFKYLFLLGVARQNPCWCYPVDKEEAVERAMTNALIDPVLTMKLDAPVEYEQFDNLCQTFIEDFQTKKLILTEEEKYGA